MSLKRWAAILLVLLSLHAPASAAMYTIENPAEKINNPADKMYNPATQVNNPAANIYNPATRMTDPTPLSPPTQAVPPPAVPEASNGKRPAKQVKLPPSAAPQIPEKNYNFKTVRGYLTAAKKAFARDDYTEFISITEDALRHIRSGTLKASKKTKQQLVKYKIFGYGLLEGNDE